MFSGLGRWIWIDKTGTIVGEVEIVLANEPKSTTGTTSGHCAH